MNSPQKANDTQVGGNHYKNKSIQPWDYVIANDMGFLEGNAIKYITRHKEKNGIDDIDKAIHYLVKLKETLIQQEGIYQTNLTAEQTDGDVLVVPPINRPAQAEDF